MQKTAQRGGISGGLRFLEFLSKEDTKVARPELLLPRQPRLGVISKLCFSEFTEDATRDGSPILNHLGGDGVLLGLRHVHSCAVERTETLSKVHKR
jgi:hypothetical protein